MDLVVFWGMVESIGSVSTYNNSGTGNFALGQNITDNVLAMSAIDVDGDGFDDVLEIGSAGSTDLFVWFNAGSGAPATFTGSHDLGATAAGGAVVGSLHGSGPLLSALLFAGAPAGSNEAGALFQQTQPRVFSTEGMATDVVGVNIASFGSAIDLTNNGENDVVLNGDYAIQCSSPDMFFPMNDTQMKLELPLGGFAPLNSTSPPPGVLFDLNGDGKPDLITLDPTFGFLEVALQ
jgi:hypothetical protein